MGERSGGLGHTGTSEERMSDTPFQVEARFRELLLGLTPGRRLAMACGMFGTAKALVRAGLLNEKRMSPVEIRVNLFLRFYGQDLGDSEREKILKRLWAASYR